MFKLDWISEDKNYRTESVRHEIEIESIAQFHILTENFANIDLKAEF